MKLAEWIVNPANEAFAGAMVNRLWAHFTGVGLVEPIDDLRASNPPTNPALFKALVDEFVKSKFDRRHLIRVILQSRTYQLSSIPTKSNLTDTRFHSHAYARRLPAEVLLDALSQSTGVPERFDGYPLGLRAVQVPDPTVKSYFLGLFGKSERLTACACERNNDVTLPQLLHMGGGATIPEKLRSGNGRLVEMVKSKASDRELTDEIFLWTLSRLPTTAERASFEAESPSGADSVSREEAFRDLFWALLNTKEFAFQHWGPVRRTVGLREIAESDDHECHRIRCYDGGESEPRPWTRFRPHMLESAARSEGGDMPPSRSTGRMPCSCPPGSRASAVTSIPNAWTM